MDKQRPFDWALARSFVAVLDAGSLMGAARRLGMHQPTLSRHVAELETQLGVPLFERTGRGVTPTAMALAITEAARRMAEGADDLARAVSQARSATSGTVRISASDVAATWLMPELLAQLAEAEPSIQVELVASNQLSNLLRREADIAVRMVRPVQASLVARKLGDMPIVAAAHERYLAHAGTPRRPNDLLRHRLIGFDRDDSILRGFAATGTPLAREHFALRTDDQVAYGRLVAAGAGIGFVARYTLAHWPGVRSLLPMLQIPPLPCWLAVHREIRGSRAVRSVYDFLARAIPARLEAG
jgi:DNA-binding transcriptional LysR family regulator